MARECFTKPTNPYHYALHCISGRWKMVILHEVYTFKQIQFNHTRKVLPITEKVLSQQLKELCEDGMIDRIVDETKYPPSVMYVLTKSGEQLLPILDALYIWSIRQMHEKNIPIETDAFAVHKSDKYLDELLDIMKEHGFKPNVEIQRGQKGNKSSRNCRSSGTQ